MKKLFILIAMITISSAAFSQIPVGTWFIGGSAQFYMAKSNYASDSLNNYTETYFSISPSVGVMISNHFEVGLDVSYYNASYKYPNNTTNNYTYNRFGVGAFANYYHGFSDNSMFYYQVWGGVSADFGSQGPTPLSSTTETKYTALYVGIMPGIAVKPAKHFMFKVYYGSLAFNSETDKFPDSKNDTFNNFNLNVSPGSLTLGFDYLIGGK